MKSKKVWAVVSCLTAVGILCIFALGLEVSLKPEKDIYPIGTTSIDAIFKNVLPGQYYMSHQYVLEIFRDGDWETITKDNRGAFFEDDSFSPSHGTKISFDITKYCDELVAGHYRIRMMAYNAKHASKEIMFEFRVV